MAIEPMTEERLAEIRRGIQAHDTYEIGFECKAWEHACELLAEVVRLRRDAGRSPAPAAPGRPKLLCHRCEDKGAIPGCPWCRGRREAYDSALADMRALLDASGIDWDMIEDDVKYPTESQTIGQAKSCLLSAIRKLCSGASPATAAQPSTALLESCIRMALALLQTDDVLRDGASPTRVRNVIAFLMGDAATGSEGGERG